MLKMLLLALSVSLLSGASLTTSAFTFWDGALCYHRATNADVCGDAVPGVHAGGTTGFDNGITSVQLDASATYNNGVLSSSALATASMFIPPGYDGFVINLYGASARSRVELRDSITVYTPFPNGFIVFDLFWFQTGTEMAPYFNNTFGGDQSEHLVPVGAASFFTGFRIPFISGVPVNFHATSTSDTNSFGSGSAQLAILGVRVVSGFPDFEEFGGPFGYSSESGRTYNVVGGILTPEPVYSAGVLLALAAIVAARKRNSRLPL
ncbi:MAG: hypothetical protein H7Y20_01845 [Bryobacteraceae bacterium]|nr:hypothetical protein [Bryobacteraceae bacterium]